MPISSENEVVCHACYNGLARANRMRRKPSAGKIDLERPFYAP